MKKLLVSKRASKAPESPIRKFVPLLEIVKKQGVEVFELQIGQPDLPTPPEIYGEIRKFKSEIIPYAPSQGIPEAISAWQKYFNDVGIKFKESEIIVTHGGSEAILFALAAIADSGDEILVFEPFYTNYNGYASIIDVKLKPITTKAENGFHLPLKKEIEACITKKTKAILFCNPNNPTGTVYSKKEIERLINIAKKHDLFILSDEVYREFIYDGESHYSIMDFPKARDRAILLDSVSKRFSACGVRIGALASKNKEIIRAVTKFAQARLSIPFVEQLAVIPLLKSSKTYTGKIAKEYKKRRDVVYEIIRQIPGAVCLKPKGAFYITVKLPIKNADHFARWLLGSFRYHNKTVMVAPAEGFYVTRGMGKDEIRIAFVLKTAKLKKAMEVLRSGLETYCESS